LKAREAEQAYFSRKGIIHLFGYKHNKAIKFYSYMVKCLKAAYRGEQERLIVDMNHFLMLKNELSMAFLRHLPNLAESIRLALELYAGD
jgi:hypothetical protein